MRKSFEYLYETKSHDSFDIEDIGNVCLQANDSFGKTWYLKIRTELGFCFVYEYGPVDLDSERVLWNSFSFHYRKIEYKESSLTSLIDKFINDPKRMIIQVSLVEPNDFDSVLSSLNLLELELDKYN